MIALKLAIRNLTGAKLRTFLNAAVLSFAFVVLVFYMGLLDGWNRQSKLDMEAWEIGEGQLWSKSYDPFDPYSLQDAHSIIPTSYNSEIDRGNITPILLVQGSIYRQGTLINIIISGIEPKQRLLKIPSRVLKSESKEVPAIIGSRFAKVNGIKKGDYVQIRWRDKNGTFDALDVEICNIFKTNVSTVDNNRIWIPIKRLQEMSGLLKEATILVTSNPNIDMPPTDWIFRDKKYLEKEIDNIIFAKKRGSIVVTILLLSIGLLAIFDTQVLSIFRRQKEIGTYIALGMTRMEVVKLFTLEGSIHSIFALILATIYGLPLLALIASTGIPMPSAVDEMGVSIGEKIFPYYEIGVLIVSVLIMVLAATTVSYFPSRRIGRLNPIDALKGKIK
ncbi:MAG TPA: FtsX-like permease family protein [Ignavibacteriaceae bacterium]|nr:FtsX-like permease family protein [Ignavibacteriaceae bacterium]